jgi:hypothetical protein
MPSATRRKRLREKNGPIRRIVGQRIGSDGLVYDELECTHRLVLTWYDWEKHPPERRHCPLCGALNERVG